MESPAVGAGVSLGFTTDLDGNAIPAGKAPSMGAYEYTSASKHSRAKKLVHGQ